MASGCGRDRTHLRVRSVLPGAPDALLLCAAIQGAAAEKRRSSRREGGREGDIGHATIASPMA